MTCECGHHAKAHLGERGLCGSPHGCSCNRFVEAKPATPQPEAIVLETSRIGCTVTITAPLARRLLALAQTVEGV